MALGRLWRIGKRIRSGDSRFSDSWLQVIWTYLIFFLFKMIRYSDASNSTT